MEKYLEFLGAVNCGKTSIWEIARKRLVLSLVRMENLHPAACRGLGTTLPGRSGAERRGGQPMTGQREGFRRAHRARAGLLAPSWRPFLLV